MELREPEFRAERPRGSLAQLLDLERADLVAERLPGRGHVALDVVLRGLFRAAERLAPIGDGFLARPPLVVQAGVDDEARGAHELGGEVSRVRIRILVEAHLLAERLGVERPALAVGVDEAELAKLGQRHLLLQPAWEMEARLSFVQEERGHEGRAGFRGVVDNGPAYAGPP